MHFSGTRDSHSRDLVMVLIAVFFIFCKSFSASQFLARARVDLRRACGLEWNIFLFYVV